MSIRILHGDCLIELPKLAAAGERFHAVVTDPPYGLEFMGREWDGADGFRRSLNEAGAGRDSVHGRTSRRSPEYRATPLFQQWCEAWARAVYDVLLPGGYLLAFGGTRTSHRLVCAIEDAGFEIRDTIAWLYGSGFPKSLDVSKSIDGAERKRWLDVSKALDNSDWNAILTAWQHHSNSANPAGIQFVKSQTEIGINTPKSGFVPVGVHLPANPKKSSYNAHTIHAELASGAARHTGEESSSFVRSSAENYSTVLSVLAIIAPTLSENHEAPQTMPSSFVPQHVWGWQKENIALLDRAVEALTIWLGSPLSSKQAATIALCAELTDALKRITLSRSRTFQNLDTISQTDCVSATTVTITESTAASLILYTVDILKHKAIDKAAGAQRGANPDLRNGPNTNHATKGQPATIGGYAGTAELDTGPATPEATLWSGWGTALKPAFEPIVVARKPLDGTVAANVLKHGCGGLNIDASRIDGAPEPTRFNPAKHSHEGWRMNMTGAETYARTMSREGEASAERRYAENDSVNFAATPGPRGGSPAGRWPANVIHDGSEEVLAAFPETASGGAPTAGNRNGGVFGDYDARSLTNHGANEGSAARFFFQAQPGEDELLFWRAKAIIEQWNPELANTADSLLSLSKEAVASALSDAVTWASQGTWRSCQGHFTPATPSELRRISETATMAILSSVSAHSPAPLPERRFPNGCHAKVVEAVEPIGTMTITISRWKSDGCADPVTFAITPMNLGHGEADLAPSKRFHYTAKADKADRADSKHPTVKPVDLIRWLVTLACPPGGHVLDCFAGSGTTGEACMLAGFDCTLIEREAQHAKDIEHRIKRWSGLDAPLFAEPTR